METKTYYIVVGSKIRPIQARQVGKVLEIMTPFGIVEQSRWFETEADARRFVTERKKKK